MSKRILVRRYDTIDFDTWNNFVSSSINGIFLFDRNYMQHHSHKFDDYSLIIENETQWLAILPANKSENTLYSHQFLTYGGLIFNEDLKQIDVLEILKEILIYLEQKQILILNLKIVPTIYCKKPAADLEFALWIGKGELSSRKCSKVLDLNQDFKISKTRQESIRRGQKNNLEIREETNFEPFWTQVLQPNMMQRHHTKPIHSFEEITLLKKKFPNNIRHFNVYSNNKIVAGSTIFIANNVAYPQHISALENRNILGSIDFLYYYLIKNVFADSHFFDFGTSNNHDGKKIDAKLIFWKESYGSQTVLHDSYDISTKNHIFINDYLI